MNDHNMPSWPQSNPVSDFIAALDGLRVPGGCDDCNAYQVVRAKVGDPNVHLVSVYHDDGCPWLAARERRSA